MTTTKTRVAVSGTCGSRTKHDAHTDTLHTDADGTQALMVCNGQYSDCANCDDRKCMDCIFRVIHDRCKDSCPECS